MESERVESRRTELPPSEPRRQFAELFRGRTDRRAPRPLAPPRHRDHGAKTRGRAPLERQGPVLNGERRAAARREMDDAARQRMTDGVVATTQSTGRLAARNTELLRTALQTEERARDGCGASPPARPSPTGSLPLERPSADQGPPVTSARGGAGAAAGPASSERTERALALVERIERLVRSGRPALALTLRDGIPGRLEVQRVAPGAISLRLASPRLPSSTELRALCQALEERGLSVRSLETSGL